MRVFVTGAHGQLGRAFQAALDQHEVTATDIDSVDITDAGAIARAIASAQPDVVTHLAAMTDVDGCARDPERALLANGIGTRNVALACQPRDVPLLYISSNEVFDGARTTPYYECDTPRPSNPYAYSKWAGEEYVRMLSRRFYIVRTAWLFAPGGRNFAHKILEHARQAQAGGPPLRVVTDEISSPTYVPDLARALAALIATPVYGIYHLVNDGYCSRYDFARRLLDGTGYQALPVEPILQRDYARPSTPPPYTALRNFAGRQAGLVLRPWEEAVDAFAAELRKPSGVRV